MSGIEWANPPARQVRRVDRVASDLRSRPGEWAKIETEVQGAQFFPWWQPIYASDQYETKIVRHNPDEHPLAFGPRDIYARYIPKPEPKPKPLKVDEPIYDVGSPVVASGVPSHLVDVVWQHRPRWWQFWRWGEDYAHNWRDAIPGTGQQAGRYEE